jgi:putative mRNA 3-end processing factor
MQGGALLQLTDSGLYCPAGDFYVDPWKPVERAVITHAHADHLRWGAKKYLAARSGELVLRRRLGMYAGIETVEYGEPVTAGDVTVSLHPAGHILGSSQVRIEHRGQVWVVSGDFKLQEDPTCAPFEPVSCHTFVTESTFGLPIFRWTTPAIVFEEIHKWWRSNQQRDKASLLFGYPLGKAQRLLSGLNPEVGPIFTHGAVEKLSQDYRDSGIALPPTTLASAAPAKSAWSQSIIVAPLYANGSPWLRRFGSISTGFASGWMRIRGARRRRSVDRGFVLSDHADWPALLSAIRASGAETVWVTHGYVAEMVRWLEESGLEAYGLKTRFEGEEDTASEGPMSDVEGGRGQGQE